MTIENLPLTEAEADEVAKDASRRFLAAKASGTLAPRVTFSEFYSVHFADREHTIPRGKRGEVALVLQQLFDRVDQRTGHLLNELNE